MRSLLSKQRWWCEWMVYKRQDLKPIYCLVARRPMMTQQHIFFSIKWAELLSEWFELIWYFFFICLAACLALPSILRAPGVSNVSSQVIYSNIVFLVLGALQGFCVDPSQKNFNGSVGEANNNKCYHRFNCFYVEKRSRIAYLFKPSDNEQFFDLNWIFSVAERCVKIHEMVATNHVWLRVVTKKLDSCNH